MTDIEQKALAERLKQRADTYQWDSTTFYATDADLMRQAARAIEQHEAFRQEVSDAIEAYFGAGNVTRDRDSYAHQYFARFIIAKPDPLVEAVTEMLNLPMALTDEQAAKKLRAAIEKRGGKIVWGEG